MKLSRVVLAVLPVFLLTVLAVSPLFPGSPHTSVQSTRQWYRRVQDDVRSRILTCDTIDLGHDEAILSGPVFRSAVIRFYYYQPDVRPDMGDEDYPAGPALIAVHATNRNRTVTEEFLFGRDGKLLFYFRQEGGQEPERIYFSKEKPVSGSNYGQNAESARQLFRQTVRDAKTLLEVWSRLRLVGGRFR